MPSGVSLLLYSRVPNKRPVSNKRPGWKFMHPGPTKWIFFEKFEQS